MKTLTKERAAYWLELINGLRNELDKGEDACQTYLDEKITTLEKENVKTYGNKGRSWERTACITNLDSIKGECNPRLAFNYCAVEHIGCPKCLQKLKEVAEGK